MVKIISKVVFSHLESDAEKKRCEIAKNNVRLDKAEFASTYFYTFALNKKFCKGIDSKILITRDIAAACTDRSARHIFEKGHSQLMTWDFFSIG